MHCRQFILLTLLCLLGFPLIARAQGSRKDDIVLNRFGQPVAGASVAVCTSGATGTPCSPLAAIYSDVALTQPLGNPMSSDGQGNYHFYAAPGRYLVQISGAGAAATTIPDVLLPADPTTPSYQSLTVTQNINAASLNLTGSLTVSGGLSSPTTVSAPEQGSAGPVQVGHSWFPGTASGTCQTPGAPVVATETVSTAPPFNAGNFSSATTYYVQVRVGNRNGWTPPSPSTAYTPASGSTNRVLIQLGDWTWRSGCFKYQAQISNSGPNGPFYPAQAETLPVASFASLTRGANGVVSAVTQSAHGFIPGESITVSGVTGGTTSFNGTFTLIGQQVNSPTTLFWLQSGAAESANPSTGMGTVIAGLGSDSFSHMAPGDLVIATVPTSGTAFANTNTAAIDADQVALNATCNYPTLACAGGHLEYPQGVINATTPLIVSTNQTILGDNSGLANGKAERSCAWKDPNLACVMVMGAANGIRVEGLDIESQGHALMMTGWGPGYGNQNQLIRNNSINTSDTTGAYSAIYFHVGTWYNEHFENNFLTGGLAGVQIDGASGGVVFVSGQRWNIANLSSAGLFTNGLLSVSSVTDPDRAQNRGAFPNGLSQFELSNLFTESATGVQFDAVNIGLVLRGVQAADPNTISGTPAAVRIGTDANAGAGNFGTGMVLEDSAVGCGGSCGTMVQFINNADTIGLKLSLRNTGTSATVAIDMNNVNIPIFVNGSAVNPYENSTVAKIINQPAQTSINVLGVPNDGTNNTAFASNLLSGSIRWRTMNGTNVGYWTTPAGGQMSWWSGDPATASNLFVNWYFGNGAGSGGRMRIYQNDGATVLFDVNPYNGANQLSACSPGVVANNTFSVGCGFRFGFNGSNYFAFSGTPTLPRTITWPDSSGTPGLVLTGTSGSLGGTALTAGNCSTTTVSVTGATASMTAMASPAGDPGVGFYWLAFVSSSNTVTVRICAVLAGTPTAATYSVRVLQ